MDYNQKLWLLTCSAGVIRITQGYVESTMPLLLISVLMYLRRERERGCRLSLIQVLYHLINLSGRVIIWASSINHFFASLFEFISCLLVK
ncbi:hypothetical protein BRC72_11505 [Halobacteriales archaeon QH_7_66_36]|nr:MAG: hypothetical protein BRC72_11505 [Halobacteriales archaeon QH_7_66_36]